MRHAGSYLSSIFFFSCSFSICLALFSGVGRYNRNSEKLHNRSAAGRPLFWLVQSPQQNVAIVNTQATAVIPSHTRTPARVDIRQDAIILVRSFLTGGSMQTNHFHVKRASRERFQLSKELFSISGNITSPCWRSRSKRKKRRTSRLRSGRCRRRTAGSNVSPEAPGSIRNRPFPFCPASAGLP